jgi:hypothetical protein
MGLFGSETWLEPEINIVEHDVARLAGRGFLASRVCHFALAAVGSTRRNSVVRPRT